MALKKFDVNSVLAQAAKKTPAKSAKKATPIADLPKHTKAVDAWRKAHADEKDAKARKQSAELEFLSDAEEARIEACRRDGKYHSSVKINGKVTVSVQNKYSPIPSENLAEIEKVMGDATETLFRDNTEISLTAKALADEEILKKLIAAVGQENFQDYFDVKQHVVPTEQFHEGRATNPDIGQKATQLIDEGLVKPYKAAVKAS